MLLDLDDVVLPGHRPAVQRQLDVLDRTVRLTFSEDEQAFALGQDRQGIGGSSRVPTGIHVASQV
jgi:hypothetical protein